MTMTLAGLSLALRLSPAFNFGVHASADADHEERVFKAPLGLDMGVHLVRDRTGQLIHVEPRIQIDRSHRKAASLKVNTTMIDLYMDIGRRLLGFIKDGIGTLAAPRSAAWRSLRKKHLEENPRCIVCGSRKNTVPHHVVPFSVDPSKELDPANLVTLCENATFNCHLFFGHLKRWDRHNRHVVEDARFWRSRMEEAESESINSSPRANSDQSF